MGAVGVEEAAAVVAYEFDRLLGRDRPKRKRLLGAFESCHVDAGLKRLRDAHDDERERGDRRERQQQIKGRTSYVDPEIADRLRFTAL